MVRRKLVATRSEAQRAIAAGLVRVGGAIDPKPATLVAPNQSVHLVGPPEPYVSRAGRKLAGALDELGITDNTVVKIQGVDDDPINVSVDFGDGVTGSGATPNHTYETAGNYEVRLVVSDGELESSPVATVAGTASSGTLSRMWRGRFSGVMASP